MDSLEAAAAPLAGMRKAIAAKSADAFTQNYGALTAACNACHAAGHVRFVRIQTPTSSPFSDEDFGR